MTTSKIEGALPRVEHGVWYDLCEVDAHLTARVGELTWEARGVATITEYGDTLSAPLRAYSWCGGELRVSGRKLQYAQFTGTALENVPYVIQRRAGTGERVMDEDRLQEIERAADAMGECQWVFGDPDDPEPRPKIATADIRALIAEVRRLRDRET